MKSTKKTNNRKPELIVSNHLPPFLVETTKRNTPFKPTGELFVTKVSSDELYPSGVYETHRYFTRDEAKKGHQEIVEELTTQGKTRFY